MKRNIGNQFTNKTKKQIKAVERDISLIEAQLKEEHQSSDHLFQESQNITNKDKLPELRQKIQDSQQTIKDIQATLALNYNKLADLKRLEASSYEYKANELQTQCPLAL